MIIRLSSQILTPISMNIKVIPSKDKSVWTKELYSGIILFYLQFKLSAPSSWDISVENFLDFLSSLFFLDFVFSSLILLALISVYEFASSNIVFPNKFMEVTVSGIAVGLITVAILSNPINLHKGIFVDARWVLLSACALFLNWRIVLIGGFIGASYRYYQGGAGGVPGVYTVIVAIMVGALWRYLLVKFKLKFKLYLQYIFGVSVELAILLLLYFALGDKGPIVVNAIAIPLLLLFPIVSVILTLLFQQHRTEGIVAFK